MTTLIFDVMDKCLSLRDECICNATLTEGNSDYECRFYFSSEWKKLVKYILFHNKQTNIMRPIILNDQNKCLIPIDVLTYGDLEFKVVGTEHNELVKSTDFYRMSVQRSIGGIAEIPEPSEKVYDKLVMMITDIDNKSIKSVRISDDLHLIIEQKNGEEIDCGRLDTSSVQYNLNYETLENLPKINDVTVIGNKTSSDYNLGYSGGGGSDDSELSYDEILDIWIETINS